MKTLYIECNMGAAGDMLMAALSELCPNPDEFIKKMNQIGLENTIVRLTKIEKQGIAGNRIDVIIDGKTEEEHIHEHHDHSHNNGHNHNDNHQHIHDDNHTSADEHHCHEHNHSHIHDNHNTHDDKHLHHHHHVHNHEEHHHAHVDKHNHGHHCHTSLDDIKSLINSLNISQNVKEKAFEVYSVLAQAEAQAHGKPVGDIHFHEVGTLDAVCDIVGCCLAIDMIAPEKIAVSPIHTGFGSVKCQHGVLPVPAPATAFILRGVPIYSGEIKGELCTPTGAALLKCFADSFGEMPLMRIEKIGYGMGKKEFERLNCVRVFLGECDKQNEKVYEISCNLDDITAEELAFSYDKLFESGALDVFVTGCVMKKGRSGHILTALAYEKDKENIAKSMLKHTTTRGVRMSPCERLTLDSRSEKVKTKYGMIDVKISSGYGISKAKPEYESISQAAQNHGVSFAEVQKAVSSAMV